MEKSTIENSEVVWVVSFGVTATGELHDYQIEEIDLIDKTDKIIKLLTDKLGDGVFTSHEAAEQWVAAKIASNTSCCQHEKTVGNSHGCCSQNEITRL